MALVAFLFILDSVAVITIFSPYPTAFIIDQDAALQKIEKDQSEQINQTENVSEIELV